MKVSELIEKLKGLPQDAEVMKSSSDGCSECNCDSMEYYTEVYSAEYLKVGYYPNEKNKHIVVL